MDKRVFGQIGENTAAESGAEGIHNNTLNPLGANPKTYIKMALDELTLDSEYAYDHYEELYDRYN